jgi:cysteinyl-tRNA synthetase
MDHGEDIEGADRKRDPLDFALWKGHKETEDTFWESPWGPGRPGWHIECSAMAEKLLGVGFEIHGGGSDLIFPHHENEAAQTRAARDEDLTRLWVHVGLVRLDSEKMSKSIGNVFMLGDALERHGPETLLMYFAGAHYHQPMEYDEDRLEEARARAAGIRNTARALLDGPSPAWSAPLKDRFFDALANDFNTPRALAVVAEWRAEANRSGPGTVGGADLREMLDILGLASLMESVAEPISDEVAELRDARERARQERDWGEADRLRDELRALGWEVRDGPDGPELLPAA